MRTQTNGEVQWLTARSVMYSYISSIFSDPSTEKFKRLFQKPYQEGIIYSCKIISEGSSGDTHNKVNGMHFMNLSNQIFSLLNDSLESIHSEYIRIFGHTLSKQTAPYELEHLNNKEVFYRTQCLADINGFYRAFGLNTHAKERADHISVEAEFLSYLLFKERIASENDLEEERIQVCRKAQKDFWNDHFYDWTKIFIHNLNTQVSGEFYPLVSKMVQMFLEYEDICTKRQSLT